MCRQRGEVARLHEKVIFLPVVNVKLPYKMTAIVGPRLQDCNGGGGSPWFTRSLTGHQKEHKLLKHQSKIAHR
jgi:hypothetical protein